MFPVTGLLTFLTYIIISPVVNRVALVTSRVARIMTLFVYELATLQSPAAQKWFSHSHAAARDVQLFGTCLTTNLGACSATVECVCVYV